MKINLEQDFYTACDTHNINEIIRLLSSHKLDFNMLAPIKKYATENKEQIVDILLKHSLSNQTIAKAHNDRLLAAAFLGFCEANNQTSFLKILNNPLYQEFFKPSTIYTALESLIQAAHFNYATLLLREIQPQAKKYALYSSFTYSYFNEKPSMIGEIINKLTKEKSKDFELLCWTYYLKRANFAWDELSSRILSLAKRGQKNRVKDLVEHFDLVKKQPQLIVNTLLNILNDKDFGITSQILKEVPAHPVIDYLVNQLGGVIQSTYYSEDLVMNQLKEQNSIMFEDFLSVVARATKILENNQIFAQEMLARCITQASVSLFSFLLMEKHIPVSEKIREIIIHDSDRYKEYQRVLEYYEMNQLLDTKKIKTLRKI